jgi:uncharacterized protein (TIGR03000 family)
MVVGAEIPMARDVRSPLTMVELPSVSDTEQFFVEAAMLQHHLAMGARRSRATMLGVLLVLSGMAMVGLPDCRAQANHSGGLIITHRRPAEFPAPQQPTPQPAVPKTPLSYFPDSDFANPSYYPRGGPKRPLPSPARLLQNLAPTALPWNLPGFEDYIESPQIPRDPTLRQPKRYVLEVTPLPPAASAERLETALLIARLPEHAVLWVEGTRTRSLGQTRYFQSPPLLPGRKYNYRVSAAWIEDGFWVSQTRMAPVQAGLIQAIYLRPALPR